MKRILERVRVPRRYLVEGFVVNFFFVLFSRSQFFFYKNDFDYYIYLNRYSFMIFSYYYYLFTVLHKFRNVHDRRLSFNDDWI